MRMDSPEIGLFLCILSLVLSNFIRWESDILNISLIGIAFVGIIFIFGGIFS